MPAGLMLMPIKQPQMFHQPGDEIQRGFPVLHAIVQRRILQLSKLEFEIPQPVFLKNLPDNVGHVLMLENPAIQRAA
jgi:hypothetical protein